MVKIWCIFIVEQKLCCCCLTFKGTRNITPQIEHNIFTNQAFWMQGKYGLVPVPFATSTTQISLLSGARVRFLAIAGLSRNFTFPVAHFQTSFWALCWSVGRRPQTGLKASDTFQYIPATANNLTLAPESKDICYYRAGQTDKKWMLTKQIKLLV